MSESSIRNYKGKKIMKEEEPNDKWVNPTSDDNVILGNYVRKCLSNGPIWYKMGYPLPHKLDENEHPHTATCQCCKKGIKVQNDLKDFHEETMKIHYSLNNNFKLLCSMVEPLAKAGENKSKVKKSLMIGKSKQLRKQRAIAFMGVDKLCKTHKGLASQKEIQTTIFNSHAFQRFGISSSASPESSEHGTSKNGGEAADVPKDTNESADAVNFGKTDATDHKEEESSSDEEDLSVEDLVKVVAEKDELLKTQEEKIKEMKEKVLLTLADTENLMQRTKREAENSKKFAVQSFAKSLLDVADNLSRASSVVKESFVKIDASQDSAGAVPLLKTLLEGVEMTEKQLAEVFKKFGVEKYDPTDEQFDPNRHNAVFQVPDSTKPADSVAVVLKAGYMLHDRILRPAEVGVTIAADEKDENKESET
ncbi:GrpE nucleotide exchange factor [Tanacetum coccineum]|uniref:GrpE protein homolog n=1 Tax=Tanacetum coccineum TaxID=301880 RepID=A0ABQ5H5X9_9ASTR